MRDILARASDLSGCWDSHARLGAFRIEFASVVMFSGILATSVPVSGLPPYRKGS